MQIDEAVRAIDGIGRLALFDATANAGFGRDLAACRRSFWAYVLVLPAIILIIALTVDAIPTTTPVTLAITEALAVIIEITAFPLIVRPLLRLYGREDRWAWLITGYNWLNAAQNAVYLAAIGLCVGPLAGIGVWPILLIQLYFYVVEAFLAETILTVGGWRAGTIVLLHALFGYGVDHIAQWIGAGSFF